MKKILAVLTLLAVTTVSMSAFAACGSNTGRNSNTRPAAGSGSATTGTTGAAGTPR